MRHTTTVLIKADDQFLTDDDWGGLGGLIIAGKDHDPVCPDGVHLNFMDDEQIDSMIAALSGLSMHRRMQRLEREMAAVDFHATEGERQ